MKTDTFFALSKNLFNRISAGSKKSEIQKSQFKVLWSLKSDEAGLKRFCTGLKFYPEDSQIAITLNMWPYCISFDLIYLKFSLIHFKHW